MSRLVVKWALVEDGKQLQILSSKVDAIRLWKEIRPSEYNGTAVLQRLENGKVTRAWDLT